MQIFVIRIYPFVVFSLPLSACVFTELRKYNRFKFTATRFERNYYNCLFKLITAENTLLQVWPEVEAGLCCLVVTHVLSGHADAVYGVMKKGVKAVNGWNGAHVEAQMFVVWCAEEKFLASVADDVCRQ